MRLACAGHAAAGRHRSAWHKRGSHKFGQLRRFGQLLPGIRSRVQRALGAADEPTRARVLATRRWLRRRCHRLVLQTAL